MSLASLAMRKMHIKTAMRYCYIPIRRVKIKIVTTANAGRHRETGSLIHCWQECKNHTAALKEFGSFLTIETCN
jgi:hypothetical protein